MIQPATRTQQTSEYYFAAKLKEIKAMAETGEAVINLGIGSPDLPPAEAVKETLVNEIHGKDAFMYNSYKGLDSFRKAVANWYQTTYGVSLQSESEMLPVMGTKEGINFISLAYLNQGDKVFIPNPGYPTYAAAAKLAGAEVTLFNLTEANNWYPDMEELEKLVDNRHKMIWVNYPNMPTGQDANQDVFEQLIRFARKHQLIICHDNPYSYILNENPTSILASQEAAGVCLELNSFSKSFNLAGCRVGVLTGSEELLQPVFKVQSNFSSGMFKPIQRAVMTALQMPETWHVELNATYRKRKQLILELLRILGCEASKEHVGMFVWAKIPKTFISGKVFSEEVLQQARVFITPGEVFGSNGTDYVRISLCAREEDITSATVRIKNAEIRPTNHSTIGE